MVWWCMRLESFSYLLLVEWRILGKWASERQVDDDDDDIDDDGDDDDGDDDGDGDSDGDSDDTVMILMVLNAHLWPMIYDS